MIKLNKIVKSVRRVKGVKKTRKSRNTLLYFFSNQISNMTKTKANDMPFNRISNIFIT